MTSSESQILGQLKHQTETTHTDGSMTRTEQPKRQETSSAPTGTRNITKTNMGIHRLAIIVALFLGLLLILTSFETSEAKKIKLKDLKKIKKYAYLLAARQKKFYAIPFPFPMPVFVKRQQIYTQIPVVPRYVQQPYHAPSYSQGYDQTYDSYAAASASADHYQGESQTKQPSGESSRPSEGSQTSQQSTSGKQMHLAGSSLRPVKYLVQLASVINGYQSNRGNDLMGKLLSGQVRILTPASLMSSLRFQPPIQMQDSDNQTDSSTKYEPGNWPSASDIQMHVASSGASKSRPRDPRNRQHNRYHIQHPHQHYSRDQEHRLSYRPEYLYPRPRHILHAGLPPRALASGHESMGRYLPISMAGAERMQAAQLAAAMAAQAASIQGMAPSYGLDTSADGYLEPTSSLEASSGESQDVAASVDQPQLPAHGLDLVDMMALAGATGDRERLIEQLAQHQRRIQLHQVAQQQHEHEQRLRSALAKGVTMDKDEVRAAESNSLSLGAHQQLGQPLVPVQLRLLDY